MHECTTGRRARTGVRLLLLAALLAVVSVMLALTPTPAFAATTFTGGPVAGDYPLFVANDGTVSALRLEATGSELAASTEYYVKIRLNTSPGPSGSGNRGFTWNDNNAVEPAVAGSWAQEREDWALFPTVTTDASGHITPGNRWYFFRFSDTTKSGTYYIIVSLQPVVGGGDGTTFNSGTATPVTLLDMSGTLAGATTGYWVHNGVATGAAGKRAEADASGGTDVWALSRTELNGVDDDLDGEVDDEDLGLAGASGDFRLAVPASQAFDVKLQNTIWPALAPSMTGALADVDIALGAEDQSPPTAPSGLTATTGNGHAVLAWSAASDAEGSVSYVIYRWQPAVPLGGVTQYTPQPLAIATTSDTTYDVADLTNGETYYFLVRAVDAATNVGPRSATVTAVPDGTAPAAVTDLTATAGDGSVALAWTNPADADLAGVKVLRKVDAAPGGPDDATADVVYDALGASFDDSGLTNGVHYYYAAYAYDEAGNYSAAAVADATPLPLSTLTLTTAASIVKWRGTTVLTGELTDDTGAPLPGKPVTLWSATDGADWTEVTTVFSADGAFQVPTPAIRTATQFRLSWPGDETLQGALSDSVVITPKVALGTPVAPKTAKKGRSFSVYGSLKPNFPAGAKTVKLQCFRKSTSGKWVLKTTVSARNVDYSSYTRYKAALKLTVTGKWRIRAYFPGSDDFAKTVSGYDYVTVK